MKEAVQKLSFFQPIKNLVNSLLTFTGLAIIATSVQAGGGPPPVDAGADQVVNAGDVVSLQGTAGCAFPYSIPCTITYEWSQTSPVDPQVTLTNASGDFEGTTSANDPGPYTPAPEASFTAPFVAGDYIFSFVIDTSDNNTYYGPQTDTVTITVAAPPTPEEALATLIADIQDLVTAGTLNSGQGSSLTNKLEGAETKLSQGGTQSAINKLQAFINNVQALINGGTLSVAEGQSLIDAAMAIIVQIDA